MKEAVINDPSFSYDIHSLLSAFYPGEKISVKETEAGEGGGFFMLFEGEEISAEIPGDMERPQVKNLIKRRVYEYLSGLCGKTLPWGTLTGIRPTKIPMKLLREGRTDAEIAAYMKDVYLTSDEKIGLITRIARREIKLIDSLHGQDGFSIYIDIPFCPSRCMYCSFTSYPIEAFKDKVPDYIRALKKEMDLYSRIYAGRPLDTVYIGGGTPTTLTADQLKELIDHLMGSFDLSSVREFTVEAGRPDSFSEEKLKTLKDLGVDRISVNPQTMNDKTLELIGRKHSAKETKEAFKMARAAGFTNINMDLILGLPGEDKEDVRFSFDEIVKLEPDSITVHSLTVKRAAKMAEYLGANPDMVCVNAAEMSDIAENAAKALSMKPYYLYRQKNGNFDTGADLGGAAIENTGYARCGCMGIYNIVIMEEIQSIAAMGAGAVSKRVRGPRDIKRTDNYKDVMLYINDTDKLMEKKKNFYGIM